MDYVLNLKTLIGDTYIESEEPLLQLLVDNAINAIKQRYSPYEHIDHLPSKFDYLILDIAMFLYSKRGAEGETWHSENGVARSYEKAYIPDSYLDNIIPKGYTF